MFDYSFCSKGTDTRIDCWITGIECLLVATSPETGQEYIWLFLAQTFIVWDGSLGHEKGSTGKHC